MSRLDLPSTGFPDCAGGHVFGTIQCVQDEQQEIQALAQRILIKAAHKLGGVGALSRLLDVGEATLADWISGKYVPPAEIILKAVSPMVDEPAEFWRDASLERRTNSQ